MSTTIKSQIATEVLGQHFFDTVEKKKNGKPRIKKKRDRRNPSTQDATPRDRRAIVKKRP